MHFAVSSEITSSGKLNIKVSPNTGTYIMYYILTPNTVTYLTLCRKMAISIFIKLFIYRKINLK